MHIAKLAVGKVPSLKTNFDKIPSYSAPFFCLLLDQRFSVLGDVHLPQFLAMYRQEDIAAVFMPLRHEVLMRFVMRHASLDFLVLSVIPEIRAGHDVSETIPAGFLDTLPEPSLCSRLLIHEDQIAKGQRNDAVRLLLLANHELLAGFRVVLYRLDGEDGRAVVFDVDGF